MWNLLNPDNRFVQIVNKIACGVVISLLWALLSCTIIGFGPAGVFAALLLTTYSDELRPRQGKFFRGKKKREN